MRYLLFSFIVFAFAFLFSFIASIIKKRFAFISLILCYLGINVYLMKRFDIEYLINLIGDIENFDLYLFIVSIVCLVIAVLESILMKNKRKNKKVVANGETVYLERDTKLFYFNLVNEDIAYYNSEKKAFVLNNSFRKRMGLDAIEIKKEDFLNYVSASDRDAFLNATNKCEFKLKTKDGEEWYEYRENVVGDDKYIMIVKIDDKLGQSAYVSSYKELDKTLKELEEENKSFSLVLSNIYTISENMQRTLTNLNTSKDVREKEVREIIVVKYITSILNGELKGLVRAYKIGGNEYAFLIDKKEAYYVIERALMNNDSIFLSNVIELNGKNYTIKARCALVNSESVNINADYHVINAAFDTLQMVVASKNGRCDYAVYQNLKENEDSINLKDMGIDLDNDIKQFYNKR